MNKTLPFKKVHPLLSCIGLALILGIVIFTIEIIFLLSFHFILGSKFELPVWNFVYQALVYSVTLIVIIYAPKLLRKKTVTREQIGFKGLPTWTDIGLAFVGLVIYFILASLLISLFNLFPWFDAGQSQDVGFNNLYTMADRLIAFISLVVVAPIAEEAIFRGWLYGKLRAKISLVPAIIIVSLLFAILHGQWNVGVNVFALSIVLCVLREITGTTYSGIIVHMLKNGIAFYLLYIFGM